MRIGILLLPTDPWPATVERAQHLERLGYDHLWVYDHINWRRYRERPWFAAIPWLTGLAAATDTIRLGTMVLNPNIRHPLTVAKDAITVDHISQGRLTLGIGAGGTGHDATIMGNDPLTPAQRIERLGEFLEVLDRLLSGGVTTHRGDHYVVDDAYVDPKGLQLPRLPIAVAAGADRGLRLAARYGNGWITWGDTSLNDLTERGTDHVVAGQLRTLARHCDALGRAIDDIDRIFLIGNTEARPLTDLSAFRSFVDRYGELGFTDLVFHHPRSDDPVWNEDPQIVERIAEILPDLRRP